MLMHLRQQQLKYHCALKCGTVSRFARPLWGIWVCFLALGIGPVFCVGASASSPMPQNAPIILRGTLGSLPGRGPVLKVGPKDYVLQGQSAYILHTLEDKRLLNHELQLVGTLGPGGDFVVQRMYDIHHGKLYKIQYYCEVCNITYVQPGHCFCCGRETTLHEVPAGQAN
jgi:hypothetical protein